jgi:hypothetical protein
MPFVAIAGTSMTKMRLLGMPTASAASRAILNNGADVKMALEEVA